MPGRNDPCPCGSGRKYKQCCLQQNDVLDFRWRQLRAAEGRLVPELLAGALQEYGAELLDAALDAFFLGEGVPDGYPETDEFSGFFVPWFVYRFVASRPERRRVPDAPRESLAADYLRRHAGQLSAIERAFLTEAARSPLSFYAVSHTTPGREIALSDVMTGRNVVVREQRASGMVQSGALLFTRVLSVEDTAIMSGCAPLVIPPDWHLPLLDARDRAAGGKGRHLTQERLHDLDSDLRRLYFQIEEAVYNPRPPEIRNTDGDPLVLTTLTYRLMCSPSAAFERLKTLAQAAAADVTLLLADAEMDDRNELKAVSIPWSRRGNRLHKEWDNTTLGTMEIDGDRLTIQVNSTRRARRIEREIAKRLGDDAVLVARTADTADKLLGEHEATPRDRLDTLEEEQLAQQPEVQEFLRQQAERHWDAWLDTRLPALGNRTPRQAARTPDGRERLEALFTELNWRDERARNAMSPDVPALRARLGLR
jgi:hypothetical protein